MTLRRFLIGLAIAMLLQGSVFAWHYRDLLYFRQPVTAIEVGTPQVFETNAREALSRGKLTRKHLETIAAAAVKFGKTDIEIQALTRRLELDPLEPQVRLRLADALRRARRFDEAERLYAGVLDRNEQR